MINPWNSVFTALGYYMGIPSTTIAQFGYIYCWKIGGGRQDAQRIIDDVLKIERSMPGEMVPFSSATGTGRAVRRWMD